MTASFIKRGFTLIELLIVIAVIGVLASITIVNLSGNQGKARDAQRKNDLSQIKTALELYYNANGNYPITGPGAYYSHCSAWGPADKDNWIPGLAPTYIDKLPKDPLRGSNTGNLTHAKTGATAPWTYCYIYRSDTGADYKIGAHCAVETKQTPTEDPFYKGNSNWSCSNWDYALYTPGAVGY